MKINIVAIVAHGKEREIGFGNKLLWHLKSDLHRFKKMTMGHVIVMGRKTFESIGRPLPGRTNIVLSKNPHFVLPNYPECHRFTSKEEVLGWCAEKQISQIFILGGEQVYRDWFSLLDSLYITEVDFSGNADTFFPAYNKNEWIIKSEEWCPASEGDQYASHFMILTKK